MNNDRDAILLAIRTCTGINPSQVKIARIRNTLELFEIQVSPALYQDLQDRDDIDLLESNMAMNCIPKDIFNMDSKSYSRFLQERRTLMAQKIKEYYNSL